MNPKISSYEKAILTITQEQGKIVGQGLAIQMAELVDDLHIKGNKVEIIGDPKTVLKDLIDQYASLFGKASIEVSKEALKKLGSEFDDTEISSKLK